MNRKFQITALKVNGAETSTYSLTISNPKDGITVNEVTNFINGYATAYGVSMNLKTAKYIDSSDTYVYPAS